MPDFRGQITDECDRQARALMEHHGCKSKAQLIELLVRFEYRRIAYLNTSEGIYNRAAGVLSATLKLSRPLTANEIERVSFQRGKPISAHVGFSGEPYLIRDEQWRI